MYSILLAILEHKISQDSRYPKEILRYAILFFITSGVLNSCFYELGHTFVRV